MKKSFLKIMIAVTLLLSITTHAQIKNAVTETVKIYGNCGMCEKTIETAGTIKKQATVDWNKDTKQATITYNSKNTSKDEILKRIALAGYDSDSFLAPDAVYDNLHGCCKYDRIAKTPIKETSEKVMKLQENNAEIQNRTELSAIYDAYFTLKDALVNTDGAAASNASKELVKSIALVQMNKLENDVHMVWMQVFKNLQKDAVSISKTSDPKKQREAFDTLSENIYLLAKVSEQETPVYLQHCPMANDGKGANWLSKEAAIKNPYYGSKMLTCGKVTATIK